MPKKLIMTIVLGLGSIACSSTTPRISDPMACVARLTLPRYAPIASNARVTIEGLTASVRLASDGTVQTISLDSPPESKKKMLFFERPVEAALRGSTFRPGCGAVAVTLVFDFRLSTQGDEDGRVVFRHPNHFEVFDSRPVIQ